MENQFEWVWTGDDMNALVRLFRQKRPFGVEQFAGMVMCGEGILLLFRPRTLVYNWIEGEFGISSDLLIAATIVAFLVFGFFLALQSHTTQRRFFILTTPMLIFGWMTMAYSLATDTTSLSPGFLYTALFISWQIMFDLAETIKTWTTSSKS